MVENFSQEQIDEIIDLYKTNTPIDEIIAKFDTNEHYIRLILKENSIDRKYNSWSQELYDRIIFLYQNGKTQKEIQYDLNCGACVAKTVEKQGIQRRTYSEANRKYYRNSFYFDNIDTPNKAYILGLIYQDGNNYTWGNKHCLTISLQEEDYNILQRVKEELEYEGPIRSVQLHEKNPNHKNQYILAITDEHISRSLKDLGVVERKSLVLTFPEFLRPDLLRHFVRGYFDGDGCVCYDYKRNKCTSSIVGTKEFCTSLSNIMKQMFINCHIVKPRPDLDSNTYVLMFGGNKSSYAFLSWLYEDCDMKLERKYKRYLDFCEKYKNVKSCESNELVK